MSTIYLMIPVTLLIAGGFLLAYIWSVRNGQFEDTTTPAMRMLSEDKPFSEKQSSIESKKHNEPK
jgi:cbb3-type cytochrome oxidase maturation protein